MWRQCNDLRHGSLQQSAAPSGSTRPAPIGVAWTTASSASRRWRTMCPPTWSSSSTPPRSRSSAVHGDVFTGPINDQDGNVRVADGETMDDGSMLGMDWFVEGVVGSASP